MLPNIFVETFCLYSGFYDESNYFETEIRLLMCQIINVFTVTFDRLNALVLNESISFFLFISLFLFLLTQNCWIAVYHKFPQKYEAAQLFSTLIIIRNVS